MTQFARVVDGETELSASLFNDLQEAIEQQSFNVKRYGATGDGVTDDTVAIQAAIAALSEGSTLLFPAGYTFLVNGTFTIPADGVRVSGYGATIKIGGSPSGTLTTHMRVLGLNGRTGVTIEGLTFEGPDTGYSTLGAESAVVHMMNSIACTVRDCTFEMTGHSANAQYTDAVFVKGTSALDNRVLNNRLVGSGINYSYAGASRTMCAGNTITDSPSNSLTANGNAGTPGDCHVAGNTIVNCGRIAIEDGGGGSVARTIIERNTILGTTTMGVSAVGTDTLVANNIMQDCPDFGIETGGRGVRVLGNSVRQVDGDLDGTATGIIVNDSDEGNVSGAIVLGNTVSGFNRGIQTFGGAGTVVIEHNHITGCNTDIDLEA